MSRLRCEVIERGGPGRLPCVVRAADGRTLRLAATEEPGARWLGLLDGAPVYAARMPDAPPGATSVEVLEIDPPTLDEVQVHVGPDTDGAGIFDAPGTTDGTVTGERTAGDQRESAAGARPEQRRTAVLAWIAADADAPPGLPPGDRVPCEPLKRLIADEPPDPLPALDGGPTRRSSPAHAPASPAPPLVEPDPERTVGRPDDDRDDTATAILAPRAADSAPAPAPRMHRAWILAGVLILLLVAWGLFGAR